MIPSKVVALRVPSAAGVFPWLALTTAVAVWATHTGTLPGRSLQLVGPAVQGGFWACLYVGLGLTYGAVAPDERDSGRRVFRKLGLSLPLALLSTHGCRLLLEARISPSVWTDVFYLRWLLPLTLVGLWCMALLPWETRALIRTAKASPGIGPLPQLAGLLVSAAVLVSWSDLTFAFQQGGGGVQARLRGDEIWASAWAMNVLILFSAYVLVFAITRRAVVGLLLVSPLYAVFNLATLAKIKYMHSAVQPLDLLKLPEFLPLFRSFFGTGALVATLLGLGFWIAAVAAVGRMGGCRISTVLRWSIGMLSIAVLVAVPAAVSLTRSFPSLNEPLRRLGLPTGQRREQARRHGMLLSFLSEVPWAFVSKPTNYSPAAVAGTLSKYWKPGIVPPERSSPSRVNLIIYLVESLMDPADLGFRYTSDPIPNLRALRARHTGGYAVVPGRFGGSANTEFEALTGMASSFLPEGSVAYRQYVRQHIPSLPQALKGLGYATTAIQADPIYYYNRERVYDLLGFDQVKWLRKVPGVERAARGDWPSDRAVVRATIQASQAAQPFFIFAFPSSTHGPHNFGTYRGSDLEVLDAPAGDAAGEVQEYINAVRVADAAIGTLTEYFSRQPDSTIIVVLSDHLPPLSDDALRHFLKNVSGKSKLDQARMTHRVPLLIWSNFDIPRGYAELGVNALPSYLLEKMGIAPPGFLAVTDAVRRELPVLGSYVQAADGRVWDRDSVPVEKRTLIEDYRLLQYDLLLGEQYSLGDRAPERGHSGGSVSADTPPSAP
jgi:hypothetical protein